MLDKVAQLVADKIASQPVDKSFAGPVVYLSEGETAAAAANVFRSPSVPAVIVGAPGNVVGLVTREKFFDSFANLASATGEPQTIQQVMIPKLKIIAIRLGSRLVDAYALAEQASEDDPTNNAYPLVSKDGVVGIVSKQDLTNKLFG